MNVSLFFCSSSRSGVTSAASSSVIADIRDDKLPSSDKENSCATAGGSYLASLSPDKSLTKIAGTDGGFLNSPKVRRPALSTLDVNSPIKVPCYVISCVNSSFVTQGLSSDRLASSNRLPLPRCVVFQPFDFPVSKMRTLKTVDVTLRIPNTSNIPNRCRRSDVQCLIVSVSAVRHRHVPVVPAIAVQASRTWRNGRTVA
jgi:hypothetical protein